MLVGLGLLRPGHEASQMRDCTCHQPSTHRLDDRGGSAVEMGDGGGGDWGLGILFCIRE